MANPTRKVFYSFHFDNDVMRVQLIRQMGVVEGDEPVSKNEWETLRKKDGAIKNWIDDTMSTRSCVIVLIGEDTANRPWVKYEIERAWTEKKGLFGIYIHNLKCANKVRTTGVGTCNQGANPFDTFTFTSGDRKGQKLSSVIKCYNPKSSDAYGDISTNIDAWVEAAIASRKLL